MFKYLRIEQVKPAHIVDFLSNLSEDGMRLDGKKGKLSGETIYYYYRVLRDIFKFAVSMQVIERSPVESVAKPKVKKTKITVYDEVKELVQALLISKQQ
ncbi:phage integrase SAM-like domain-containing protein [Viridibacillus sp. NPDC093762]|uniref:phage integrase SAM-like domain-containing protein n=1 Tax=Viridibacillus sp. NPDC093762 TaxID=3390720 RepID=UPI003CFD144D